MYARTMFCDKTRINAGSTRSRTGKPGILYGGKRSVLIEAKKLSDTGVRIIPIGVTADIDKQLLKDISVHKVATRSL